MSGAFAVAGRVLRSIRGDKRTLALVVAAPTFITFLFSRVLDAVPRGGINTAFIIPVILGFFAYFLTYILTAIGFLRERVTGTLERVLVAPVRRVDLVVGYVLGYGVLGLVEGTVLVGAGLAFFDITLAHGVPAFYALTLLGVLSALGLGILVSFFAANEFQVLQFIPVVIAPQVILGGVFVPVAALPWWLEGPARVLPLTHLLAAMDWIVLGTGGVGTVWTAVWVLTAYTVGTVAAAALAVGRRI